MPLISYGGTSAVSLLAGFGLVMAVRSRNPVHGGYASPRFLLLILVEPSHARLLLLYER